MFDVFFVEEDFGIGIDSMIYGRSMFGGFRGVRFYGIIREKDTLFGFREFIKNR